MKGFALTVATFAALAASARAHDLERTRVTLTFAENGAFVLDISHDPNWLWLRLESFNKSTVPAGITAGYRDARIAALAPVLIDRVVLWVDGREIRPDAAEYLAADGTFRLRGTMPLDARTLRWLYGSVGDPYPLIVRRADGRMLTEIIDGSNWSGTIDLSNQFKPTRLAGVDHVVLLVGLFAVALLLRVFSAGKRPARRFRSA